MFRPTLAAYVVLLACSSPATQQPDASNAIVTPVGTWTWVPLAGTACGNGTETGIGVNAASDPTDLFVYFEGGGACWDANTCFVLRSAINIDITYDAAKLATDVAALTIDRASAPVYAHTTFVFVPYCTGDLHAGNHVSMYDASHTVHHVGSTNTTAIVDALRATVPAAQHVWVSGSSAGGYGATLNFHRFTDAWPTSEVHLLQDSSPFVPVVSGFDLWQSDWDLQFPPGCTSCNTSFPSVVDTVANAHPTSRIGLLHYDDDAVVRLFFGYSGSMVDATNTLLANQYAHPNTKYFVLAGTSHTMLGQASTLVTPGGVHLSDWLTQWVTGDPAWASAR